MRQDALHFLVSESGPKFIAHCLDYDLITSADTYHEAVRRLAFITAAHSKVGEVKGRGRALLHSAPESYWLKFEHLLTEQTQDKTPDQPYSDIQIVKTVTHAVQ